MACKLEWASKAVDGVWGQHQGSSRSAHLCDLGTFLNTRHFVEDPTISRDWMYLLIETRAQKVTVNSRTFTIVWFIDHTSSCRPSKKNVCASTCGQKKMFVPPHVALLMILQVVLCLSLCWPLLLSKRKTDYKNHCWRSKWDFIWCYNLLWKQNWKTLTDNVLFCHSVHNVVHPSGILMKWQRLQRVWTQYLELYDYPVS